jgi:hypothetical protein
MKFVPTVLMVTFLSATVSAAQRHIMLAAAFMVL